MAERECTGNNGHSNNLIACTKVECKTCRALSALFSLGVAGNNCPIAAEVILVRYCKRPTQLKQPCGIMIFTSFQEQAGQISICNGVTISHPAPAQAN